LCGRFSPLFNLLLKLKKKIFQDENAVNHAVPRLAKDKDKTAS
jgi:hypothetical protein